MGSHHTAPFNPDERYVFADSTKKRLLTYIAIGVVMVVVGIAMLILGGGEHHDGAHAAVEHAGKAATDAHAEAGHHGPTWMTRLYADLWHNTVFFMGIAIIGVFFVAVQYVAWAGWSAGLKRIPEAFGAWLPFGAALIVIVFALGYHDLFHWTHSSLYDVNSPDYDKIIASKQWWLNWPFYLGRMFVFLLLWNVMYRMLRSFSLKEDNMPAGDTTFYNKSIFFSAIFIIIFAVSSSTSAWDWVMSIDTHWYSTMFGWYMFASWWVSGLATITLTVILLKEKGYLQHINENHLHDLGKFMFAFSIFWTYLWFSQFMLIYYANISEETVYFSTRFTGYDGKYTALFYFNIVINFVFPFLFLITRASKRLVVFLKVASVGLLIGHWLDFYLMIMPGVTKGTSGFGFLEFGLLFIFASAFVWVVAKSLASAPLVAKNHPMLEESLHHEVV